MNVVHSLAGTRVFLGCGLIGAGLVKAAITRGETCTVWNRTASKANALAASSPLVSAVAEAAVAVRGAGLVHIALTSDDACDAVCEAIADALEDDAIVVDHSTTSPERTAARANRLTERGVSYLHAPVFMSPVACEGMKGAMLAAGPEGVFRRVEDALALMTGKLMYVGDDPGRAAATKLVGNGMILSMVGGLADVFEVGKPHGIRRQDVLALFENFDVRNVFKGRGARMAEGEFEALWTLTMARKDLGLMLESAPEAPVLGALAARADALITEGHGDADVGILAGEPTEPDS